MNRVLKKVVIFMVITIIICTFASCGVQSKSDPTQSSAMENIQSYNEPRSVDTPVPGTPSITPNNEPPLSFIDLKITVPDFLSSEQQDLYRQAYALYTGMFGSSTENIDLLGTPDIDAFNQRSVVELNGMSYIVSSGIYQHWVDFDAVIHAIFTDKFWNSKNVIESLDGTKTPIFIEHDKVLCYLPIEREVGYYYNSNFEDEFHLIEQDSKSITFSLIGHYSLKHPINDETTEENDARLKGNFEYTKEFTIQLVKTEVGWRFDSFYSACADEGEYQGNLM